MTLRTHTILNILPFLCVEIVLKEHRELQYALCPFGLTRERNKSTYSKEYTITGCYFILSGDDGMREGEDVSCYALSLLLHQLPFLHVLLLQGGQSLRLLPLKKLPKLLKVPPYLLLCGLRLVLPQIKIQINTEKYLLQTF